MTIPRALSIGLAAVVGVAIGWVINPATSADTARVTKEPVLDRETRRPGNEDSRTAATKWVGRMKSGDVKTVAKEVPADEIKAVMNALMDGVWGTLSNDDIARMQSLMGEWASKDPEGALAWARSLRHPTQRELGLSCIAAAIGQKDPEAGFAIYTEVEKVTIKGLNDILYGVVSQVCDRAAKESPAALLEVMGRIPKSENFGSSVHVGFPNGFDFEALLSGMTDAGYFKRENRTYGAFYLEGPLSEWAARDREAAFAFLTDHVSADSRYDLIGLSQKLAETSSQSQTKEWLGGKLAAMDPAQRQALVIGSLLGYSSFYLNPIIEMMPTREASADLIYDILQANNNAGWTMDLDLLNQMPEMEERIAIIERLQGLRDDEAIDLASLLRKWDIPQERITGIIGKVKRKE